MKRVLLCFALSVTACGGDDDSADADAAPLSDAFQASPTDRYFPVEVGNTWSYDVEHLAGGVSGVKVQTVEAVETLTGAKAGVTAFRLRSDKPSGEHTLSWQEDTGDALVRHLETSFDSSGNVKTDEIYEPQKLRLDESAGRVDDGARFSVAYTERVEDVAGGTGTTTRQKDEQWTVEAVDVAVTVPAGTFSCLQVRRVVAQTGSDKTYWFARGVGKVREESANQIEELRSFSVSR